MWPKVSTYSCSLNAATTPWIFIEFIYNCVLKATKICLQAVNKGPIAAVFQLHFDRISNFHREGNKGKQISNKQLLYTKPNFGSDKVVNLQFLLKSLMKNRKHHKKCLLFEGQTCKITLFTTLPQHYALTLVFIMK